MEAVHNHTSTANQMEHQIFPNNHISKTSLMAEKGRTMMPSVKSAQAKETIEKKDMLWYLHMTTLDIIATLLQQ